MVTVREATLDDADAIGRVHAETWRAAYADVLPEAAFDVDERRGWWRQWLARAPQPPLGGNDCAERFYRLAGWTPDGGRKVESFHGAEIVEVRYRKPL